MPHCQRSKNIFATRDREWEQMEKPTNGYTTTAVLRFEDLRRRTPVGTILVYLTDPNYTNVRLLLTGLKPGSPNVIIYYASRPAPEDALQPGKLVGEIRPLHTTVFFEAKAAAALAPGSSRKPKPAKPCSLAGDPRQLRERLGLTQTEMAHALDVSLRTVQNQGREGHVPKPRRMQDLAELWQTLEGALKLQDIAPWIQSKNDAFGGMRPVDLLPGGRVRDIIVEFRRLQSGEPI